LQYGADHICPLVLDQQASTQAQDTTPAIWAEICGDK